MRARSSRLVAVVVAIATTVALAACGGTSDEGREAAFGCLQGERAVTIPDDGLIFSAHLEDDVYVPDGRWPLTLDDQSSPTKAKFLAHLDVIVEVEDVRTPHAVIVDAVELKRAVCGEAGEQPGSEGLGCLLDADRVEVGKTRLIKGARQNGSVLRAGKWPILGRQGDDIAIGVVVELGNARAAEAVVVDGTELAEDVCS